MFKEVFATLLFSVNLVSPSIKKSAQLYNQVGYSYCLKDEFDLDFEDRNMFVTYQVYDSAAAGYINCYAYDIRNGSWLPVNSITIDRYDDDPTYYTLTIDYNDEGSDPQEDFTENVTLSSYSTYWKNLVIYFEGSYFIADSSYSMFLSLFTPSGNSYVRYYVGYYSYATNLLSSNSEFILYGSFLVNNSLYNYFYRNNGNSFAMNYLAAGENNRVDIVTSGNLQVANNFYLDGVLIPTDVYTQMTNVGVFGYQRDNSFDNTTFKDLLFSIMDTPIYFMTRLLSFELFGVNMFVAFTGLLTICVILVLIRKFF